MILMYIQKLLKCKFYDIETFISGCLWLAEVLYSLLKGANHF